MYCQVYLVLDPECQDQHLFPKMVISWFQKLADSDISRQYHIGFWGTQTDINYIIWANIRAKIVDMVVIVDAW